MGVSVHVSARVYVFTLTARASACAVLLPFSKLFSLYEVVLFSPVAWPRWMQEKLCSLCVTEHLFFRQAHVNTWITSKHHLHPLNTILQWPHSADCRRPLSSVVGWRQQVKCEGRDDRPTIDVGLIRQGCLPPHLAPSLAPRWRQQIVSARLQLRSVNTPPQRLPFPPSWHVWAAPPRLRPFDVVNEDGWSTCGEREAGGECLSRR